MRAFSVASNIFAYNLLIAKCKPRKIRLCDIVNQHINERTVMTLVSKPVSMVYNIIESMIVSMLLNPVRLWFKYQQRVTVIKTSTAVPKDKLSVKTQLMDSTNRE